ncbi:MAG: methanogenesis marker protein Mmp4/MtxX [Thermoplasmata archaeon]|nr:MAG: methanogenesis marker protein Mmp4/MtxX [Thermoplasmata archaeon]
MARKKRAKVGIGDGSTGNVIKKSVESAQKEGFAEVEIFNNAQSLTEALDKGGIEAAVRGTLDAKTVLSTLKSQFGMKYIMRIAFLDMDDGRLVLLAPVGVDEGMTFKEKLDLMNHGCDILSRFKIEPMVGVLSGGRLEDLGRHKKVDETVVQGVELMKRIMKNGIWAEHFGILIEKAFCESNLVISQDGITGNLIFRTLHFFGGAKGIGAPIVNLDRVFVDTSRAKEDYSTSIALASALSSF